jgi:phenylacetate-CoA ligase
MRCLKELEASQWWPPERVAQLQSARLQHLIHYAYERVPYYRRLMDGRGIQPDDIRTAADLSRLPVLTKAIVREEGESLLARGFPRRRLREGHTGGSTGTPLVFYSSTDSRLSHGMARSLRAQEWAGLRLGDPFVRVIKRRLPGPAEGAPYEGISRRVARESFVDCGAFSESTLPAVVERIAKQRSRALRGYASAICIIAEYIRDSGLPAPEVGAILTGGEQLFDEQRALLKQVFGVEPFSKYSSFENFDIAMECEAHRGMHIAAEDLAVEIADDDGLPVPPGQEGRILVTNLHEYGMPLIRYDTDDSGSFEEGPCTCGRSLPRLSAVTGKTGNTIYTPSGKRLSPLTLGSSGLAPLGIKQFQFVQEELDRVTVKVVPGTALSDVETQALSARLKAHYAKTLGHDVRVDVMVVDHIEPTPAGKHLFLISKVSRAALSGGTR